MKTLFAMIIMMIIGSSFSYSQDREFTMIMNRKEARPLAFKVDAIDSLFFTQDEVPDSLFQLGDENYYYEEIKYDSLFHNDGFINYTGTINHFGEGFTYTDLIDIKDANSIEVYALMKNPYGGGISLYTEEGRFLSSIFNITPDATYGGNTYYKVDTDTLPHEVAMIRVQSANNNLGSASLIFKRKGNPSVVMAHDPSDLSTSNVQADNLPITLDLPDIRHFYHLNFRAQVTTFDTLTITRGRQRFNGTIIKITTDSVLVMLGDTRYQSYAHRLKIDGMINTK